MRYDTKGIRVTDLREAGLCLGLARGGRGSKGDGIGGYDVRSDIFEVNALDLPERHRQTREGEWGKDERPRGWRRSSGALHQP